MGFEGKNHRKDTKKAVTFDCNCLIFCGATRNRTGDTRIFYLPAKCLDNYFSNYFIHFLLIADFQRIVLHVYLHSRQCLIASIDTLIS